MDFNSPDTALDKGEATSAARPVGLKAPHLPAGQQYQCWKSKRCIINEVILIISWNFCCGEPRAVVPLPATRGSLAVNRRCRQLSRQTQGSLSVICLHSRPDRSFSES